jgi:hypothetical protein
MVEYVLLHEILEIFWAQLKSIQDIPWHKCGIFLVKIAASKKKLS